MIALHEQGHYVVARHHNFENQRPSLGYQRQCVELLLSRPTIVPHVRVFHMTPNVLLDCPHYRALLHASGIPNLVYFAWETTKLPEPWTTPLQLIDGIIVPCQYQRQVIENAGIRTPIEVVGHPVNTRLFVPRLTNNQKITFYSIFQWSERKNPVALLRAFWSAFRGQRDVRLILKTYCANTSRSEQERLHENIRKTKAEFPLRLHSNGTIYEEDYPDVTVIDHLLGQDEIIALHQTCDCFVLLHRGEGFGLPIVEAMACGTPVIATNFYACQDYLTPCNSYPVTFHLEPVHSMSGFPWYDGSQYWAAPHIVDAIKHMREVYANTRAARQKGREGRRTIEQLYSCETIGRRFTDAIRAFIARHGRHN